MRRPAPSEFHSFPRALNSAVLRASYRREAPTTNPLPELQPAAVETHDAPQPPVERTRLRKTTFVQNGHIHVME
jgi:hypothetical protein